ncbi:uncharacterized protein Z520_02034 [Fonsecaea multimorphosa CBS 102226]|uniref:Uncharacterized protein n=1 Tax=Fonsecaea multimorphosa CBS 102226 TaxID=1442371 RepID=A0A0D2HJ38_9EURO|nr:uncharacterized protein Z520_02034 [Fonsecaea multimorphosa CBS 102226]KIY01896.1 hypothetical protein Z520_02034 [Fonsecaea multimorphosa CBS 102226]OAL29579.1 hypothetical protein AYO22_01993 [Fonsecaea multimorphosa]
MASESNSQLSESWVVEDEGDERISWEEHSAESEYGEEPKVAVPDEEDPKMTRAIRERRKSPRLSTPTAPEPEFIMPSLSTSINPPEKIVRRGRPPATTKVASAKQQTAPIRSGRSNQTQAHKTTTSPVVDKIVLVLVHATEWLLDILGQALKTLKRPISWLLAAYLFFGMLMLLQNLLTTSIYTALSPICRIPGVSLLDLPLCQFASPNNDKPTLPDGTSAPVEFDALMKTQSHFEEILSESAAGVALPLDMKRSETSIRDLRQIVRYSQLASRNEMVLEFDGFIETARMASYDLQKFNSHVGRGVDIVLSTARWTQRVLDDMAVKQSSRGIIPGFIQDKLLAPFKPVEFTEARLLDQYISHTRIVSEEIERLIEEAQALLLVLQNLEDRLDVIHAIALRDNIAAQAGKDEILSHLWTLLGGNRAKLGKYNNQLTLLRQVGQYRKVAWAHVSATILKLQAMGAELEELRTRVSSAEVLRGHKEIPLAVHVENIRLGVQRLEEGREKARRLEQGHVRRVIEGAEQGNVMALGDT